MNTRAVAVLAALALAGLASAQEILALPDHFEPTCISGDGLVVGGGFADAAGTHPALWTRDGGLELLRLPGGDIARGRVWAINVDGSAAAGLAAGSDQNPMRWTRAGGVQLFTSISGAAPSGYGISDDGRVVVGTGFLGQRRGFTWTAEDGLRNLPDGGDGQATCVSGDGRMFGGGLGAVGAAGIWLWSIDSYSGRAVSAHDPLTGWARALNRAGDVMVGRYTAATTQGFLWTTQGFQLVPAVESFEDVTADGRTAVGYLAARGAAYYTQGLGAVRLDDFLHDAFGMDLSAWSLDVARGISYDGRVITGSGTPDWVVYLPAPRPGDFDGDEQVTTDDLVSYLDCFVGEALLPPTAADVTKDDFTDWIDFDDFLASF